MMNVTDTQTAEAEAWKTYHERRELAVVQPLGSLALVNTQIIDSEQPVWGVPGRWAPLPAGESGLTVTAAAADGIRVDGELVDGRRSCAARTTRSPGDVVFSDTLRGFVIAQRGRQLRAAGLGREVGGRSRTSAVSTRSTTTPPG